MGTTPDVVTARIEDILRVVPGMGCVLVPDDASDECADGECPIPDELLPAALVIGRGVTRSSTSADIVRITETLEIGLLVTKLCNATVREQRRAVKAANAFREVVPTFFRKRARRLALNGVPLTGVMPDGVSEMNDAGVEFRPWAGETYAAVTYTFTVTYTQ